MMRWIGRLLCRLGIHAPEERVEWRPSWPRGPGPQTVVKCDRCERYL